MLHPWRGLQMDRQQCAILEKYFYRDIVPLHAEPGNIEIVK